MKHPWVTPAEVKAYTDYKSIQARADKKLEIDISRAERHIISITNTRFDDPDYPEIPEPVKTAVILVAEVYAFKACEREGGIKSESYDDYSYTLQEGSSLELDSLDLKTLLADYIIPEARNSAVMKLRKL